MVAKFISGFNTQPPEGGWGLPCGLPFALGLFQHTAARRRLDFSLNVKLRVSMFQHTAARRRLVPCLCKKLPSRQFQHTAARRRLGNERCKFFGYLYCFNTQPPEGGWVLPLPPYPLPIWFQHTAARRRLDPSLRSPHQTSRFNTQPPEGGWLKCLKRRD